MKFTSISKSRESLRDLSRGGEDVIVLRDTQPVAVMVSYDHYEALRALAALSVDTEAQSQMEQLHAEVMAGSVEAVDLDDYERQRSARLRGTRAAQPPASSGHDDASGA